MADRIVFMCTGNICRSPLAEVLAAHKFGGLGWSFCSAGLEALAGLPASRSSVAYAAQLGLSLADHRSQPVTPALLADTAWVIGMTRSHAAIFRSRCGVAYAGAVGVLGAPGVDLARVRHSPSVEEVDDPYGQSPAVYTACGDQIDRLLNGWADTFTMPGGGSAGVADRETSG